MCRLFKCCIAPPPDPNPPSRPPSPPTLPPPPPPLPEIEREMLLDDVLDHISALLSFYQQLQPSKPKLSVWSLPQASRFEEAMKGILSDPHCIADVDKACSDLCSRFPKSERIAVGLLLIASLLERFEDCSGKEEILVLIQYMHRLARCVKQIKGRSGESDLIRVIRKSEEDSMHLVIKCCLFCLKVSNLQRLNEEAREATTLSEFKRKIQKKYIDLMQNLGVSIYIPTAAAVAKDIERQWTTQNNSKHEPGDLEDEIHEVVDMLELHSQKSAVAVVLVGGVGMGKTTLAEAVYAAINVRGWRFSRVCLFEYRNWNPDIIELQSMIVKNLTGFEMEVETPFEGQMFLQQILQDQEAFILIDNVLSPKPLENLLPTSLHGAKKLRLLLTAESDSVVQALPVKDPKVKYMKGMKRDSAMQLLNKALGSLRKEQAQQILDIMEGNPLPPMTINFAASFIGDAEDKEQACATVMEIMSQFAKAPKDPGRTERPVRSSAWQMQKLAYVKLSEEAKETFQDICNFFRNWEWWNVESIVGEKALQELQRRGFVSKKEQEEEHKEEESEPRIARNVCRAEVNGSLLDIGLEEAQGLRFTDMSDLRNVPFKNIGQGRQQPRGIYLLRSSSMSRGYIKARDLDSWSDSLRILSFCSTLVHTEGKCKRSFDKLIFLQADDMEIPFQISKLQELRYLSVWARRGQQFDLSRMSKNLRVLHLWGLSQAESFTFGVRPNLKEFCFLRSLLLHDCDAIKEIPASISDLKDLKILNLKGWKALTRLPQEIDRLTSLEELRLDLCEALECLPDSCQNLGNLKVLSLKSCVKLSHLPDGIGYLSLLIKLDLKACSRVKSLPKSAGQLNSLQYLNLIRCQALTEFPPEIYNLNKLKFLYFWNGTFLRTLPEGFGALKSLTELELNACVNLVKLPEGFGQLKALRRLELCRSTNLLQLSQDFPSLRSLEYLDISECAKLEDIWLDAVLQVSSLKLLYLANSHSLVKQWESVWAKRKLKQPHVFTQPGFEQSRFPRYFRTAGFVW